MKTKHYRITSKGTLVETRERMSAHLSAASLTEAKEKVFRFAKRALEETPQVRTDGGAVQVAYWNMDGVAVQAGYGARPDLCLSGESDMRSVSPDSASFKYYVEMARRGE